MIYCQNCRQTNVEGSNFCRFCGFRFAQMEERENFDFSPPRPYVWKTDEFQTSRPNPRKTNEINQVQPLSQPIVPLSESYRTQENYRTQAVSFHQPGSFISGYRCPRCASQLMPRIEKQISSAGWIVFSILLITFFPLFWIGFFLKEDVRVCQVCNFKTRI